MGYSDSTNSQKIDRRAFLQGCGAYAGLSALGFCAPAQARAAAAKSSLRPAPFARFTPLPAILADADRITGVTVCLRPFRAAGPRLEVEKIGDTSVVHHYGHGGSGWSLSWGSASMASALAMKAAQGAKEVAVLGAGVIGLTTSVLLQRAGARVTIYAKDFAPNTRSSRATGTWAPDFRIALASSVAPGFPALWETMARRSFRYHQRYRSMSGLPLEWSDRWSLSDQPFIGNTGREVSQADEHTTQRDFIHLYERIADLTPFAAVLPPGSTLFPTPYVMRTHSMTFNVPAYSRQILSEFLQAGGKIITREFHSPQEFTALPEKVIVNCPGYGARDLWGDQSIVPIRGQIAWLQPQEDVHYGLQYKDLFVLARRDGIAVQSVNGGDNQGWNDTDEEPDRASAVGSVAVLQDLYARMAAMNKA